MEISPLDVRSQVFRKKMKGYDPEEVKQFLDTVADLMERMLKEKEGLEKENAAMKEKTDAYAQMEQTLRDTLLTAQKVSADARANAEQSSQNIIREAEVEAKKRVSEVQAQVDAISRDREMLRSETIAIAARLRSLLESHLSLIDGIEEEVAGGASSKAKSAGAAGGRT